jgi:putative oxidoreductase
MMTTAQDATQHSRGRAWLAAVLRTPPTDQRVDVALAVVRIALAWIFIYYGGAKLFGWFDGAGIHGTSEFMANTAHLHPGGLFAVLGGLLEFFGAIALVLGIGSRLVGAGLLVDMVMAMITVTWTNGINSEKVPPGYELNVVLAALALVVLLLGAGRYSLDALAARRVEATAE